MDSINDLYTSCFCEENIWNFTMLIKELTTSSNYEELEITAKQKILNSSFHVKSIDEVFRNSSLDLENMYVIFISNKEKKVPIWNQRSGSDDSRVAVWDYHVVALYKGQKFSSSTSIAIVTASKTNCAADFVNDSLIFDFDSSLPFPSSAFSYIEKCFAPAIDYPLDYHPMFRVISASDYLSSFASDRSHMLKEGGNGYITKPPSYAPIRTDKSTMNLPDFISMEINSIPSQVKNLQELVEWIQS